ncbi:MAG: GntP family permease [Candidatus Pelagadaptatus aseana]|uniref:GntP family permease n=1 Tax=Candidatus Pelagadaptatus aseana TaxID=3120508 RepID=UPI0039B23F29
MTSATYLLLVLLAGVGFIIYGTTRLKWHPFIVLLLAAYGIGFAAGMDPLEIGATIRNGFGGILGYIGIIILLGTLIGTILERTGAAITMANTVLKLLGDKAPGLAMSIMGYIVSIPVFCDSGYVILSSLKRALVARTNVSAITMTVCLATGLFASHTLIPPTPGPIAAAGNLGLSDQLGLVILVGVFVSIFTMAAGYAWALFAGSRWTSAEDQEHMDEKEYQEALQSYGTLPSAGKSFAPILVPILLISLGSIAAFPSHPFGEGSIMQVLAFLGKPINALLIGFFLSLRLLPQLNKVTMNDWMEDGLKSAAIIIMITGVGGSLGAILKATGIGETLGNSLAAYNLGIFLPFIVAAAFKTAQGSSTVALVATSALVAPMLASLGLDSDMGRVLTVMAIGAGAMTVSHANDSYFWVVTQFSRMDVATSYKTLTLGTLVQGLTTISVVAILSLVLL